VPGGIAGPPSPRGYEYGTWSFRLGLGLRLTTSSYKNSIVEKLHKMKAGYLTRKRPRAITEHNLRIATWNVLSLYRGKALHNLLEVGEEEL
jgi:hypothetical protein